MEMAEWGKNSGMVRYIYSLPDQIEYGLKQSYAAVHDPDRQIDKVLIIGMGGSAIGGEMIRCCAMESCPVPVMVVRDYRIPAYVDRNTLVIAVSYSGNTEETLTAYTTAVKRGARVAAVTTGGKLHAFCHRNGVPCFLVPGGLPPRAANGFLLSAIACILDDMGFLCGMRTDLAETVGILREMREELIPSFDLFHNRAFQIARALQGNLPVIWSSGIAAEVAGMRWKGQINENGKAPAYHNCFPELDHNEIAGFVKPDTVLEQMTIVVLEDGTESEQIKKRIKATLDIIGHRVKSVCQVQASGKSRMARLYSLCYLGDFVSYYLACLYGVEPEPVEAIERLKAQLDGDEARDRLLVVSAAR
ncbi:MAG: bifunctional phosphoglucose/phosphomannose isomerase [Solirubrobacterales bacterium]